VILRRSSSRCVLLLIMTASASYAQSSDNEFARRASTEFPVSAPSIQPRFITGQAHIEGLLQLDNFLSNGLGYAPFSALFAEGEARANVNFGSLFSINGLLRVEQVRDQTTGAVFADEAIYIQRLFGVIHVPPLHFYGGKIHPRFGIGWWATPGLYGTDFDEDYELVDKIGAGVRWDIGAFGRHRFTAEIFQADTSFLSNSLVPEAPYGSPGLKRPSQLYLTDGGPSNTGALESFAFALSGRRVIGFDGFGYDIGWAKQKASPYDVRDEYSWVVSTNWLFNLSNTMILQPMAEFVSVSGQGGNDRNVDYLTVAAQLRLGPYWTLGAHSTQRYVRDFAADNYYTEWLAGIAVAYDLGEWRDRAPWLEGLSVILGYRYNRIFGVESQTVGMQIKYAVDF
jgi:hypothetical protein